MLTGCPHVTFMQHNLCLGLERKRVVADCSNQVEEDNSTTTNFYMLDDYLAEDLDSDVGAEQFHVLLETYRWNLFYEADLYVILGLETK